MIDLAAGVAVGVVVVAVVLVVLLAAGRSVRSRTRAVLTDDGYQEARVTINGRYRPDTLRVRQGVPVRIRFHRGEDNPCSERVVFSAFGVDRRLAAFQETTVEFVPTSTGTFLFTCQWGMYRGKLVVTAAKSVTRAGHRPSALAEHRNGRVGEG